MSKVINIYVYTFLGDGFELLELLFSKEPARKRLQGHDSKVNILSSKTMLGNTELNSIVYGLNQSPRVFFEHFSEWMKTPSKAFFVVPVDSSIYELGTLRKHLKSLMEGRRSSPIDDSIVPTMANNSLVYAYDFFIYVEMFKISIPVYLLIFDGGTDRNVFLPLMYKVLEISTDTPAVWAQPNDRDSLKAAIWQIFEQILPTDDLASIREAWQKF
jgi:hypothetical protein